MGYRVVPLLLVLAFVDACFSVLYPGPAETDPEHVLCEVDLDIAIVGGGPSGSYSAYKLKDRGLTIGLFEYSSRIGGRVFSLKYGPHDRPLELGAMRYIYGRHLRLMKVIDELGLPTEVFTEGFGKPERTRMYYKGRNIKRSDWIDGDLPFNLTAKDWENRGLDNIFQHYLAKLTGVNIPHGQMTREQSMNLQVPDGRFLYQLTMNEALLMVTDEEGIAYARVEYGEYLDDWDKVSAHTVFYFVLGGLHDAVPGYQTEIMTISGGMSSVVTEMLNTFVNASTTSHFKFLNHQLKKIRRKRDGRYVLWFDPTRDVDGFTYPDTSRSTKTVCARRVILGLPMYALRFIDWPELRNDRVRQSMAASELHPASKVFMTFDRPWWLENRSTAAYVVFSDEEFSQMYDWKTNTRREHVLIASYTSSERTLRLQQNNQQGHLREKIHQSGTPNSLVQAPPYGTQTVSAALTNEVLSSLGKAFGLRVEDIPAPTSAISQFWTGYPFGGGWVNHRAGYNLKDVAETIRHPSLTDEVYIVGSDFACTGTNPWIDSSMMVVDDVMERYFDF